MRSSRRWRGSLVIAAALLSVTTHAEDLGVVGPVYPIAEPNLLEVIVAKLREADTSGRLAMLQQNAQTNVTRAVEQPAPIANVTKTSKARSFYYDPSIVVPTPLPMPKAG